MKVTLRELKRVIRSFVLLELDSRMTRPMFAPNDPVSPELADRESLGYLADGDIDVDDAGDVPAHLKDPVEDPEECWGPVPPTQGDPYVQQDPFTRGWGVLPTPRR